MDPSTRMKGIWWSCCCCVVVAVACVSSREVPRDVETEDLLRITPTQVLKSAGDNVTFTCSYPSNATLRWHLGGEEEGERSPLVVVSGGHGGSPSLSRATLVALTTAMTGEVRCSLEGHEEVPPAVASLTVFGVGIGGSCRSSEDCGTDKSSCQWGYCKCPKNHVLLRLRDTGYQVCREMISRLYAPCQFVEQCSHLVDSKSVCSSDLVCVCAPWAIDVNGRCMSKNKMTYKSQEMYRVGLIAVTCIIILIVALSLWITLRRSCREQSTDRRRSSVRPSGSPEDIILEGVDKPPSYEDLKDDALLGGSPPDFKDALKHCPTAKRLLRQASAPAGQLLPQTPVSHLATVPEGTRGHDNRTFSAED